jgi:hypothetical protein
MSWRRLAKRSGTHGGQRFVQIGVAFVEDIKLVIFPGKAQIIA